MANLLFGRMDWRTRVAVFTAGRCSTRLPDSLCCRLLDSEDSFRPPRGTQRLHAGELAGQKSDRRDIAGDKRSIGHASGDSGIDPALQYGNLLEDQLSRGPSCWRE